jgi:hypothetical protein
MLRGQTEIDQSLNRGFFSYLVSHKAELDSILEDHMNNATVATPKKTTQQS